MTPKSLPIFRGHSASKLDLTERCGHAGTLKSAAGRSAVISSAAHALAEGDHDRFDSLMAALTEEERAEVSRLKLPVTVELMSGVTYEYSRAFKEKRIALDANGCPVDFESEDRITRMIVDYGWVDDDIVIVGDLKRFRGTSQAGVDSLQVHAAGIAIAQEAGCNAYLPTMWFMEEGEMAVGQVVRLDSAEATRIWDRIKHAAQNQDGPITGEHCSRCYGYFQCSAWVSQVVDPDSWLAPLSGQVELTDESAAEALVKLEALEKAAGRMKDAIKTYVTQGGRVVHGGKSYEPVMAKGRKTLDRAKLEEAMGDISWAEKQGRDYPMWKWVKVKP